MASFSNTSTPTGILRRKLSIDTLSGKRGIARARDNATHLGSPTSRVGVQFAAPENLSDLLLRAASSDRDGNTNRKVYLLKRSAKR